ncbi:MAG: hypothetical protein ACR2GY_07345 [Phycisphaerales bacterium]
MGCTRARQHSGTLSLLTTLAIAVLIVFPAAMTCAQPSNPAPPASPSPARVLREAIVTLASEARAGQREGRLPRENFSFAEECRVRYPDITFDAAAVFRLIEQPADRDPFVDAYIRWQLLGFQPKLPATTAWREPVFLRCLANLPALPGNPRADRRLLATANRALALETLSESDTARLREMDESLRDDTSRANNLARPGLELRAWLIEQLDAERGVRAHLARLEELQARIDAGWPVDRAKNAISAALERAVAEQSLTEEEAELLAAASIKLSGRRTAVVRAIRITENVPAIEFDEVALYDFEVNVWLRTLRGKQQ